MDRYIGLEDVLTSILATLVHIKQVESEIITLSQRSSEVFVKEIKSKSESITPEVLEAIQLQDIILQQFSAIAEAIDSMERHLAMHTHTLRTDNSILHASIQKLYAKMINSLKAAKSKQASFSGHSNTRAEDRKDEIEFF
ncbi:MAG: hypothetical protein Q7S59_10610 [Sulfurimonas sp.]|nr:hypothetical protein [Sulfurimonas sp.]